jgi:hypothetical protein
VRHLSVRVWASRRRAAPPAEPATRGGCVDPCGPRPARPREAVFPHVQQHIPQRSVDLPRASQAPHVVTPSHHLASPTKHPVHSERNSRDDRHHAAAQRHVVIRLDDHVNVIPLHQVVNEPKALAHARNTERLTQRGDYLRPPKRRQSRSNANCHQGRSRRSKALAPYMMNEGPPARLPPCILAWAAASRAHSMIVKRELTGRCHRVQR